MLRPAVGEQYARLNGPSDGVLPAHETLGAPQSETPLKFASDRQQQPARWCTLGPGRRIRKPSGMLSTMRTNLGHGTCQPLSAPTHGRADTSNMPSTAWGRDDCVS